MTACHSLARLGHIPWKRLDGLRDEKSFEPSRLLSLSPKPEGREFLLLVIPLAVGSVTGGRFSGVQVRDK